MGTFQVTPNTNDNQSPHSFSFQMACELRDKAIALFTETFGEKPSVYSYAPGRVNFIGEHTDYCEGFVCPLAIHYGTAIVGRKVPGKVCDLG